MRREIIAGLSFLTAIVTAAYTFIKYPDKLHSEHYLIEMQKMEMSKEKEDNINGQQPDTKEKK